MKSIILFALLWAVLMASIGLPMAYLLETQEFVIVSIDYNTSQNLSVQLTHPRNLDIIFIDVERESNLDGVHTIILKYKVRSTMMYNTNRKMTEYMYSMDLNSYYDYSIIDISKDCN